VVGIAQINPPGSSLVYMQTGRLLNISKLYDDEPW